MMPNFIRRLFRSLVPVERRTVFDARTQLQGVAALMDADRLHAILSAADSGSPLELFALFQDIVLADSHLQAEFSKRKLAVLGDKLAVLPRDKKVPADVEAADAVRQALDACPSFVNACIHLLDSTLWPVSVVEKIFQPIGDHFALAQLVCVPDQLLDFTAGRLRIRATNAAGVPTGGFFEADAKRYMVHRGHLLTAPDHRGGPLRSLVWWWFLATANREWWGRFLDRFGTPFPVGKFDQSDDESRMILTRAFSYATRLGGLVVSKETEVELLQAAASQSGDAFEKFHAVCRREMSKLILGQTLSAEVQSGGLGSGGASAQQEEVRQDVRQFDSRRLGDTLRTQLFEQFLRINGMQGSAPLIVWGGESPVSAQSTASLIANLARAGISPTDEALATLSERLGFGIVRSAPPPAMSSADDALRVEVMSNSADLHALLHGLKTHFSRMPYGEFQTMLTQSKRDWLRSKRS